MNLRRIIRAILMGLGLMGAKAGSGQAVDTTDLALRLERWIDKHAKPLNGVLLPGSPEATLDRLEGIMGCHLPEAVRKFYMSRDGQNENTGGVFKGEELLSTQRILMEWHNWKKLLNDGAFQDVHSEPGEGVKNDWWNPKWIPLTYDGHGNHYCLDMDPAPGGHVGQIILMLHDEPERPLIAASFDQWMSDYVRSLEAGEYVYSEGVGGIVTKKDARAYDR